MFFLGAPDASWLPRSSTPLMLSRSRLADRKAPLPTSAVPWYLDSAAFTELEQHGRWTLDAYGWAQLARRWGDEAGQLVAIATQDWLCTPTALDRTGLTIERHQDLTTLSYLELREYAPELPWVPTLQGWLAEDYLEHAALYELLGVDLAAQPLVGVGSIAMRQEGPEAERILWAVHDVLGLRNVHAYGAKELGLRRWGWAVSSADSMAWSMIARREARKACAADHADCRNCITWAEQWARIVAPLVGGPEPSHRQRPLFT